MNKLIYFGLFFGAFHVHAQSKTLPIVVQCNAPGPQYEGTLTIPDRIDGKCVIGDDKKSSSISESPSEIILEFNNLTYVASYLTYHFTKAACDPQNFASAGYPYSYQRAYEKRSNFHVGFVLVQSQSEWVGQIGSTCEFRTK